MRLVATGTTVRVSLSHAGAQVTSASSDPSISTDGTRVAFYSTASTLVTGDTNNRGDVFVRDLSASTTLRKSLTAAGAQVNEASSGPWLAGDGTALAFASVGTNLVPEDSDATSDIYVRGPGLDASTYAYDRLYRLTQASEPVVGTTTYACDPIGNRLTRVRTTTTTYAYDRADRITAAGATVITVNATGATAARGTDTFAYDQAIRLRTATVAGITETSTYDGDGVRFNRQVGAGPVIRSVTDPTPGLPVTIDDGTRKYVWGLGLAYAVSGTAIEVQHADRLGSIRAVSDGTGTVIATYRTDEFGIPTASTGAAGSPFRYTGEPLDASGLTYLRARHYDATIGRFMTRDPFAGFASTPLSLNRYSYVANNPATWSDPSGKCLFLCAAVGAAIGGLVSTITYFATTPTEDWTAGSFAGSVALGAATGAVIGFTGGVAAGAVGVGALTVAEGTVLVGTAGYATGLFTSGAQKAMGKPVTAGTVFWNVVGSVTGGVIGGPATATLLSSVARRLLTSVFSIGKGIAASTASAPSSAGSASNSGSPVSSGSRVLGK